MKVYIVWKYPTDFWVFSTFEKVLDFCETEAIQHNMQKFQDFDGLPYWTDQYDHTIYVMEKEIDKV